jgi:8-oxo-dGTP pyrophosphatase MutT (NUDIX family)
MAGAIDPERVRRALAALPAPGRATLERPRRAAVAVVLAPSAEGAAVLLIRRAERQGDPWSGHMALPGGHAHPEDADLLQTARRETLEEVGVDLATAELLGQLDDVTAMRASDISVRPFVFWAAPRPTTTLSHEVAEIVWVPLDSLAHGELRGTREVEVRGTRLQVPAFVIGERVVWGMTFHLLERFLSQVLGEA